VFGPLGVTNIRTFVNPQNPTHVAVLMDIENLDTVMAFMQTPAAAEAMAHDGVVPVSLVLLVEERGSLFSDRPAYTRRHPFTSLRGATVGSTMGAMFGSSMRGASNHRARQGARGLPSLR
jgi:hypothetical protein